MTLKISCGIILFIAATDVKDYLTRSPKELLAGLVCPCGGRLFIFWGSYCRIIDDAQLLPTPALEELRLFTNFRLDSHSPLTLILLAQPEFRKMIQLQSLQAFSQRISLRTHLSGLQQNEIAPYIKHQLEMAGRTDHLFSDDVMQDIYQHARGLPRLINSLGYECLLETFLQKKNIVDTAILEKVMLNYEMP